MPNIMINKTCNLKCPYCFANEFVNHEKDNMDMERFEKAVDYIIKSGHNYVGIIGGEPTLHPLFEDFVEYAASKPQIKDITIFTNGVNIDKHIRLFTNKKVSALINLNSPDDIGQVNYNKIISNLDKLSEYTYLTDSISLGINMYKPDFDYVYMLDALMKYGLRKVRTSISVPNTQGKKEIDPIQYFKEMKPRVFKFFRELQKIGVTPNYDCNNMPICITTDAEKEWLKTIIEKHTCNINDNPQCEPVLDILPDLEIVRCFGCSEQCKVNIDTFENLHDVSDYFKAEIDNYAYMIPVSKQCIDCYYKNTNQCSGGCIAFKQYKINKLKGTIKSNIMIVD